MTMMKTRAPKKNSKPITLKVPRTHKPEDLSLEDWQRALRKQFGEQQKFILRNNGDHPVFSEFSLTNPASGKTYRLAIRGNAPGDNFCSCPDFSINNLGTCKHLEFTLARLNKRPGAKKAFKTGFTPPYSEVFVHYGLKREIRLKTGLNAPPDLRALGRSYFDAHGRLRPERVGRFTGFIDSARGIKDHEVRCYDDVLALVAEHQDEEHRKGIVADKLGQGIQSPVFHKILKTSLYPYQKEGALFAAAAGRCLIGDDMGLGKTVQALAASELMHRLFHIGKVLIVAPTSLKHQWRTEIERFTGRTVVVVEGTNSERTRLYKEESYFKVINYEVVFRDTGLIKAWAPDLIVLDEAQRIKNWNTRTAKSVKLLESPFAVVLTGTPLENKIEELHSLMEFIDRRHFGPLYLFAHNHRVTDATGKVTGYRKLNSIRESLKGVMLRRTKNEVLRQLPERTDKNFFVTLTQEQFAVHDEYREVVARLVAKWRRFRFLCDADQKRLLSALTLMRMVSDNTYLVDKKTIHGPKIEELEIILKELVVEGGEKVVIFTQWLKMAELVREILKRNKIGYTQLHGGIPSKNRRDLITKFREDPDCKVFLSTDAGGVGLNLQSGSVVINVDIPWNPAVLEQRIGRVHRMGQKKPVRVINFVTSGSIEERILELLKFKRSVFAGALDADGQDTVLVGESQLNKLMKTVETMVGDMPQPDQAAERQRQKEDALAEKMDGGDAAKEAKITAKDSEKRHDERFAALGDLLQSGARLLEGLGDMLAKSGEPVEKRLGSLIGRDEPSGRAYLKLPLPSPAVLNDIVSALSGLISRG
jgi:superfamily II DNA or RNA helicase